MVDDYPVKIFSVNKDTALVQKIVRNVRNSSRVRNHVLLHMRRNIGANQLIRTFVLCCLDSIILCCLYLKSKVGGFPRVFQFTPPRMTTERQHQRL